MKPKTRNRLLTALILLNLAFIWGNSAMTAEQSGGVSSSLLDWIKQFLPMFAGEAGHHLLRKLAHFSEFACLGVLGAARMRSGGGTIRAPFFLVGLAPACVDETIQLYVPGRASSLLDVWLDAAGFAAGSLVLLLGCTIYEICQHRMNTKIGGFPK